VVYAVFVSACLFPSLRFVCLYYLFFCLQSSLNQGARCLDQRFGFFWVRSLVLFITPANYASAIKNSSTLLVRSSLLDA
jgi:hypothetical protein